LQNAPNVSSDAHLKTQLTDITELEHKAALEIKKTLKKFKFKTDVKRFGNDASYRFGVIAQDCIRIMESYGLDPENYTFITVDENGLMGIRYEELLCFIISSM